MIDRHAEVRQWFDRIASTWPRSGNIDLPEIGDPLAGVTFPEDIPPVSYEQMTDHAKRVFHALDRRKAGRMEPRGKTEKMLF